MTGNSHFRNCQDPDFGSHLNSVGLGKQDTLPAVLTRSGYQTRAIGKMHFSPPRRHYGFEHMELLMDYYNEMKRHTEDGIPSDHGLGQTLYTPAISTVDESHSLTRWTVEKTVNFLETRDETRPFFCWTSFSKPHPPFDSCANYWQLYEGIQFPEPVKGDWSVNFEDIPDSFKDSTVRMGGMEHMNTEQIQSVKRAYYACVTQIDHNLGLLFGRLMELDLIDNTLIIFTADHGDLLGDHGLSGKMKFLEGSAHVPFILCPPRWTGDDQTGPWHDHRHTAVDDYISLADLMPTSLKLAEAKDSPTTATEGRSILDLVKGERTSDSMIGYYRNQFMHLKNGYKYLLQKTGDELFFNLNKDPYEENNLTDHHDAEDQIAEARKELSQHYGTDIEALIRNPIPNPDDYIEDIIKFGGWPGFNTTRTDNGDVIH